MEDVVMLFTDSRPVTIATIVRKSGDCEQYVDVAQFLMDPQVKVY